jgi:hypothetical protein
MMEFFNATPSGITYVGPKPDLTKTTGDQEQQIQVTFAADAANPVLAWGGHIASRFDWGCSDAAQSASGISGSPYHMRVKEMTVNGKKVQLGNQDRSLSAAAVIAVQPGISTSLTEVDSDPENSGASITVTVGASVVDSATLTGTTPDAGGTISYAVYSDNTCTTLVEDITPASNTVVNGVAPDSDPYATDTVGTFYFQASYSGQGANLPATSACTEEVLTVQKASPTIATQVKDDADGSDINDGASVAIGTTVYDTATLTGGFSPGGTVEYFYQKQTNGTPDCTDGISLGMKNVTAGSVPDSDTVPLNAAGTYEFWAVYSGDANNNGDISSCDAETVVVGKNSPSGSTTQSLIPNDTLTLTGATTDAGGTVDFYLFAPGVTCSVGNIANAAYKEEDVALLTNDHASTGNTEFIAQAEGTWTWLAIYSGDANNDGFTSNCVETFAIDNDTSG